MCHCFFLQRIFYSAPSHCILRIKKFAKRERVSYVFSNRTANLALRAIIDCNISRACATQHSTYLCDLPRAILKRYLSRRNKLIYLSIYLRSGSLRMRARSPFALCIARARVLYFGIGTYGRVKLLPCALYQRGGSPPLAIVC